MFGAEERLRPPDREALDLVDPFAGVVVTMTGIPIRVLGRQNRPLGLQHGAGGHALGGDQVERGPLAGELTADGGT